jgi:hypothetical protein
MQGERKLWAQASLLLLLSGCTQSASRIHPVEIDISSAARGAIEMYDKDGDGELAAAELDSVPGLKKHIDKYDTDGNQQVSRDEIAQRLTNWSNNKLAIMGDSYVFTLDGRPLAGATVTFVPEPYLEPHVKPASSITTPVGLARPSHAEEFLPKSANGRPLYGVTSGTFKIQVNHTSIKIPPKYNSETILGDEIAYDTNPSGGPIRIELTSR